MPRRRLVHLSRSSLTDMVTEAALRYPDETGGVLVGRRAPTGIQIETVIGPGPKAGHARTTFDPDTDWQQGQLDALWTDAPAELTYLGDWHTHPDGRARPSPLDLRAARSIADSTEALQTAPLTLILGISSGGRIDPACYQLRGRKLKPLELELEPAQLSETEERS